MSKWILRQEWFRTSRLDFVPCKRIRENDGRREETREEKRRNEKRRTQRKDKHDDGRLTSTPMEMEIKIPTDVVGIEREEAKEKEDKKEHFLQDRSVVGVVRQTHATCFEQEWSNLVGIVIIW